MRNISAQRKHEGFLVTIAIVLSTMLITSITTSSTEPANAISKDKIEEKIFDKNINIIDKVHIIRDKILSACCPLCGCSMDVPYQAPLFTKMLN